MINKIKQKTRKLLKTSEKYTKTDMIYLTKGGFWLTLGQGISSISAFLLAIAFANLLPKETYGAYKYAMSLVGLLSIPTLQGMEESIKRAVARGYEGSLIPALKTKIKWGSLGAIASLTLAGYYFLNNNPNLTFSFLIIAVFIPFMDTLQLYESFLEGKKLFKSSTKYRIIVNSIATASMIGMLFLSNNLFLILLAYFATNTFLRAIFTLITIKRIKPNKKEDPETIPYGKHLSFIKILGTLAGNTDKILLWHYLGAIPLAVYSFAIAPVIQIRKLSKNIMVLAFPKLAQREISEIKNTLPSKIFKFFLIMIPIVVIYILIAPYFYKIIFPQYINAILYSQIFALVLLFQPKGLIITAFTAHSHKKKIYFLSTTTPIIRITLLLVLLPLYGILGAIMAMIGTELINLIILIFLFKRL